MFSLSLPVPILTLEFLFKLITFNFHVHYFYTSEPGLVLLSMPYSSNCPASDVLMFDNNADSIHRNVFLKLYSSYYVLYSAVFCIVYCNGYSALLSDGICCKMDIYTILFRYLVMYFTSVKYISSVVLYYYNYDDSVLYVLCSCFNIFHICGEPDTEWSKKFPP